MVLLYASSLCDGYIDGDTVECPLHQGVFCISTGQALESPATIDLKTYKNELHFMNRKES